MYIFQIISLEQIPRSVIIVLKDRNIFKTLDWIAKLFFRNAEIIYNKWKWVRVSKCSYSSQHRLLSLKKKLIKKGYIILISTFISWLLIRLNTFSELKVSFAHVLGPLIIDFHELIVPQILNFVFYACSTYFYFKLLCGQFLLFYKLFLCSQNSQSSTLRHYL